MALNQYEDQDRAQEARVGVSNPSIPGLFPDAGDWIKTTFMVSLQEDFQSYREILEYALADETFNTFDPSSPAVHPAAQSLIDEFSGAGPEVELPRKMMNRKFRDTSLGGNDAINCYPQFNENDDIVHPYTSIGFNDHKTGMGRVYSETIDDAQQILYMTFGVPDFKGVASFYTNAIKSDLARLMSGGDVFSAKSLGHLFGTAVGTILTMPFWPLYLIKKTADLVPDLGQVEVSKYYDLKSTMPLYYKCVNSMIAHMAVNLGLVMPDEKHPGQSKGSFVGGTKDWGLGRYSDTYSSVEASRNSVSDMTQEEQYRGDTDEHGLPSVFQKHGWDIYSIMQKKYLYNNAGEAQTPKQLEEVIDDIKAMYQTDSASMMTEYLSALGAGFQEAMLYVGFRIEKSVDNNESFSNATGESSLASTLNGHASSAQEAKFTTAGGELGIDVIDGLVKGVTGVVSGIADQFGIGGLAKTMIGSGRLDIPEVWKDSSFTKAYSFNMALRSPYGDPISIMQNIYIPLAMLLAGALPRAVGPNAYTSPFVVSAYSKGMIGIPLGIIDSMNIRRGAEQHGWNYQGLPTCIDVSFTIKDLSPTMYMALASGSDWFDVFGQNSTFQEYLLTLSGVGMADRLLWSRNFKRRIEMVRQTFLHEKLNPLMWGFNTSQTRLGRIWTAMQPTVDLGRTRE